MFSNTRSKKTKYSDPRRKPRTSSHREPVTRTYRNLSSRKSKRVPQPSVLTSIGRPSVGIVARRNPTPTIRQSLRRTESTSTTLHPSRQPIHFVPYADINQERREQLIKKFIIKMKEAQIIKKTQDKKLLDNLFNSLNRNIDYTTDCKGETDCPITSIPLSWLQENKRVITLDGTCYSMYIFATQPITANVFQYNPFRIGTVEDKSWTPPTQGIIDTHFKNDQIRSALKVEFDAISNLDLDNLPTIRQIYSNKPQPSKVGGRSSRRRTRRNHRKT